ncbi:hypothetical protein BEWA_012370 [Theileria equi strain WA]|uniref:Uncharacterized protein n=1 Tax=Theileria equi strain WA TaxID=1537102 RepID=L1LBX3_THEEQ|nr:hypothetical protein BEWA_012370 [Theileria equi strain WA]EKX72678.1 hypothetical protein BEWA_012370 [Theileria equi strain WA]|eukprot:XP_004832130.1 hypothetical protein BEWA_012370 [Theileria equi strain WA]
MDQKSSTDNKEALKHGSFVVNFSAISFGSGPSEFLTKRAESLDCDKTDTSPEIHEPTCYIVLRIRVLNKDCDAKHWGLCSEMVTRPLLAKYKKNDHGIVSCLLNHSETLPLYLQPGHEFYTRIQEGSDDTNCLFQSYKFLVCIGASVVRDGKVFCLGYGSRVLRAIDLFGKRLSATLTDNESDDVKANTSMLFFGINVKDIKWVPSDYVAMLKDYSHRKEDVLRETNMGFLIPETSDVCFQQVQSECPQDTNFIDIEDLLGENSDDIPKKKNHNSHKFRDLDSNRREVKSIEEKPANLSESLYIDTTKLISRTNSTFWPKQTFQCLVEIENKFMDECMQAQPLERILGDMLKSLYAITIDIGCSTLLNKLWIKKGHENTSISLVIAGSQSIPDIKLGPEMYEIAILLDLHFTSADLEAEMLETKLGYIKSYNQRFEISTIKIGKDLEDFKPFEERLSEFPEPLKSPNNSANDNNNEKNLKDIKNVVCRLNLSNEYTNANSQFFDKNESLVSLVSVPMEKNWALIKSKVYNVKSSSQGNDAIKFIWPNFV